MASSETNNYFQVKTRDGIFPFFFNDRDYGSTNLAQDNALELASHSGYRDKAGTMHYPRVSVYRKSGHVPPTYPNVIGVGPKKESPDVD